MCCTWLLHTRRQRLTQATAPSVRHSTHFMLTPAPYSTSISIFVHAAFDLYAESHLEAMCRASLSFVRPALASSWRERDLSCFACRAVRAIF